MADRLKILSTGFLGEGAVEYAANFGVELEQLSFIKIDYMSDGHLVNDIAEVLQKRMPLVFTSVNAVKALIQMGFIDLNNCAVYGILGATLTSITSNFKNFRVKGEANDASELSKEIIGNKEISIAWLCGDLRLDALPKAILASGIGLHEIVVYKTISTPHTINKHYDGLLFYSPSAVDCFFTQNTIEESVQLFSIGATTTHALKKYTNLSVSMPAFPSKAAVLDMAIKAIINSK